MFCRLGWCMACVPNGNDYYLWSECVDCGRRHGEVSRAALRARIERGERL